MKVLLQQQQYTAPLDYATSPWSVQTIADILGSPVENVQKHWPSLLTAFAEAGVNDAPALIAALATIGVEAKLFMPVDEAYWLDPEARERYYTRMYEGRRDLGNILPGDGARYHGRGLIQLTGRANYETYGRALGVPLLGNPDLVLDPDISARVFVKYFMDRGIPQMARAGRWADTRIAVNGGLTGWDEYIGYVRALQGAAA